MRTTGGQKTVLFCYKPCKAVIYYYYYYYIFRDGVSLCCQAGVQWLFIGAIPLLFSTGVLTCSISNLGQFTAL